MNHHDEMLRRLMLRSLAAGFCFGVAVGGLIAALQGWTL